MTNDGKFGSIKVQSCPFDSIKLVSRKDPQAEEPESVNNLKFNFKRELQTSCVSTNGCYTTKDRYLFTDGNECGQKLVAIDLYGETEYILKLNHPHGAYDLTCIDNNTVAVTTGYLFRNTGILIIDLTTRKIKRFIELSDSPYGITFDGKSLICCSNRNCIHIISCTDFSCTNIPSTCMPPNSYITTHGDNIFAPYPNQIRADLFIGVKGEGPDDGENITNSVFITVHYPFIQNVLALDLGVCGNLEAKIDQNAKILHEILGKLTADNRTINLREVANGKPAEQSSVLAGLSASRAVDGSVNTYMHTLKEQSPYWIVDLGKTYQIKRIEIFNRNEGAKSTGERLHDLDIIVGPSHNKMHLCAHYVGPAQLGAHLIFECEPDENARYVKLMIKGTEYLHVAEIKVYAVDDRSS
ncbi:unnamed protein product [Mytilus edulis]|uniref:Fucolectin tachylectin-4 pentraxin-1 domain-containing protein n=1 Tax=Mytilus edulis TaxID=6550 RepID=A0A8S3V283_MYTED|nr:unnamed protein product [Mytilus edulis]